MAKMSMCLGVFVFCVITLVWSEAVTEKYEPGFVMITYSNEWNGGYSEPDPENTSNAPAYIIEEAGKERGEGLSIVIDMKETTLSGCIAEFKKYYTDEWGPAVSFEQKQRTIHSMACTVITAAFQYAYAESYFYTTTDGRIMELSFSGGNFSDLLLDTIKAIAESVMPYQPVYGKGYIISDSVRMRSMPDTTGKVLKTLTKNTGVQFIARKEPVVKIGDMNSPWFQVKTNDGTIGYVYGFFIQW